MTNNTNIHENIEGAKKFQAWKYRVLPILEEDDFENYVKEEFAKPKGDEYKARHKNNMVKSKRIIDNSIKDHLIPHVSSLNTPKEMFDALTSL